MTVRYKYICVLFLCIEMPLPSDVGSSRENIDENTKIVSFRGPHSSQRLYLFWNNKAYGDYVFVRRMHLDYTEDNLFEAKKRRRVILQ